VWGRNDGRTGLNEMASATDARSSGDSFDEVVGSAISKAVRWAVDDVGRPPLASLGEHAPAAAEEHVAGGDASDEDAVALPAPVTGEIDPYELLGVTRAATWEQITAAYRRRARAWHPDGADPVEAARRHDLIRDLNAAYRELRVRRGR
jgi:hypothetical protein